MFLKLQFIKKCLSLSERDPLRKKTSFSSNFRKKQRMRRMQLVMAIALLLNPPVDRTIWMIPRSNHWFEIALTQLPQEEWYANFRVSKDTFNYILSEIAADISRKDTKLRKAISAEKRLAITLNTEQLQICLGFQLRLFVCALRMFLQQYCQSSKHAL